MDGRPGVARAEEKRARVSGTVLKRPNKTGIECPRPGRGDPRAKVEELTVLGWIVRSVEGWGWLDEESDGRALTIKACPIRRLY